MRGKRSTDWVFDLNEFLIPSYEEWEKVATSSLKGKPFERLFSATYEGIQLKPIYISNKDSHLNDIQVNKKGNNNWIINQELSGQTIDELLSSIENAIKYGQTTIHFHFKSESFLHGVEITNIEDLNRVLHSTQDQELSLFVDTHLQQSAVLVGLLSSFKTSNKKVEGVIGTDPIGEWVRNGTLPSTLSFYYEEMAVMVKETKAFPNLKTILVSSHPFHNGGANSVQELAYTLSVGIEYVRQCLNQGLKIDEIAPKMAFSISIGSNMFMEMAKLRAANYLWSSIIHEFGGNQESQKMWIHAKTSITTKTTYDPYVNMLRSTVESFAAVVGGANSIQTSPFDEAFQKPTSFSNRIARNVQSILLEEANLGRVVDPSKGSWYVEGLTKEFAEKTWQIIQQLDQAGGIVNSLIDGDIQHEIGIVREERFKKVDYRKEKIVGVNMYANVLEKDQGFSMNTVNKTEQSAEKQVEANELSLKRPDLFNQMEKKLQAGHTFSKLQSALQNQDKEVDIEKIPEIRWSMKFEQLRKNSSSYYKETGEKLAVKLVNLGELIQHKARTDFIKGFFEVGGFYIKETNSLLSMDEIGKETALQEDQVIIICGDDSTYTQIGRKVVELLKSKNPDSMIFIAGNLEQQAREEYKEAGLRECIHMKTNCYQFLDSLQKELGVNDEKA
jgi:methylmalonyl-CoA mutase